MTVSIKICGLRTAEDVRVAADAGARYVGFVFYEPSPRHLDIKAARALALEAPAGIAKVALVVDADDKALDALVDTVPLDMLQLHGRETPDRVSEIRSRYGLPVMKAVGIADRADLDALEVYEGVADQILVDAKPPKGAARPGGNGIAFDWALIAARQWARPWMLAGGLTAANVVDAIRLTGTRQIDMSSSVESAPGIKDPALIRALCDVALRA